ncbi:hypothetical protein [Serratia plymuthica]|uniref:hypothetical protein n=1 Tax=Serratia plymuthica TaxID=82996 RepID=UPI000936FF9B|nr:hypothetical protein [Serratia plymuthica]OJT38435.1 hypothetical protein BSR04_18370 [Serratia plymuthica]
MRTTHKLSLVVESEGIQIAIITTSKAVTTLSAQGIAVKRIDIEEGRRPTVVIHPNATTRRMAAMGKAVRYSTGVDDLGRYQKFQYQLDNCRVVWEERGNG